MHLLAWDWIKRALPRCPTGSRRVYYLWHTCRSQHMLCYWLMIQTVCKNIPEELTSGKKAVGEQTCSLQLQMIMVFFFQLHSLTWIPHYPVLWKRVESFHSNPVWYSQFYEDEDFQKENSQKKKRKEVVVYPVPARTLACRHFLIYTVGSYLHGKDISETKGIDKNKCKEAWSSFFSYTVCFLF